MESPASHLRRDELRETVRRKRTSMKDHEFEYVNALIDSGKDDEIELLANTLNDSNLFFDHSSSESPSSDRPSLERGTGSVRRLQEVTQRKSCNTRSQLWRRTSRQVMAANRISSLGKPINQSLRAIILEDESLSCDSEDDSDDSRSQLDEKKEEEEGDELEPCSSWRPDSILRASVNLYHGEGFEVGEEELLSSYRPDYDPWQMSEKTDWEGHTYDFHILGTSSNDPLAQPHVLSPPLMDTLESHLPEAKRGESFWLKYSLVRDGASRATFLQNVRGSEHTLLAMETLDGEVFGCFVSSTWSLQPSYFGSGECFLWRMKSSRAAVAESVLEQAEREKDIDVFPYTFENGYVQLCQHDKIGVGGGTTTVPREVSGGATLEPNEFGCSILFDGDYLLNGSTSACLTFSSPSLSKLHADGSTFELINLEAWTLTPCLSLAEAQIMECKRTFLKRAMSV